MKRVLFLSVSVVLVFVFCVTFISFGRDNSLIQPMDLLISEEEKVRLIEEEKARILEEKVVKPTFKNHQIDTSQFLFDGKCGEVFKYRRNNKRDLLVMGLYSTEKGWDRHKEQINLVFSLSQSGIPNATKILFLYGNEPENGFIEWVNSFGIQVIKSDRATPENVNAAVFRYLDAQKYLEENKEKFDRVAITDTRDVLWFGDGFATFSKDELIVASECTPIENGGIKCFDYTQGLNYNWMKKIYGSQFADDLRRKRERVINCGMVVGGTQKILDYLHIYLGGMKSEHFKTWGQDQAALNYLYYSHQLDVLNITVSSGSQRIGFDVLHGTIYDAQKKILIDKNSLCSPVLRHKIVTNGFTLL